MITAEVIINVPALPDADVWFANSAAWSNYWRNLGATININPAATTVYVPVAFDNTLPPADFIVDDVHNVVPTIAQFNSLVGQVAALAADYQNLRTQLKDAGFITNAQ